MANNRSDVSNYPSKYSQKKWVTASQYIAELICERAAQHSKRDLPQHFWNDEEWAKFFVLQKGRVDRLLKKYDAQAIINAVKKKNLRAVMAKWVEEVIQKEQTILNAQKRKDEFKPKEKPARIINQQPRKRLGGGKLETLLALDEEIEHGKEE